MKSLERTAIDKYAPSDRNGDGSTALLCYVNVPPWIVTDLQSWNIETRSG